VAWCLREEETLHEKGEERQFLGEIRGENTRGDGH